MNIPDWLKLFEIKPRYTFALSLFGWILILMPNDLREYLSIDSVVKTYLPWLSLGTIASTVLWLAQLAPWNLVTDRLAARNFRKEFSKHVARLSNEERLFLAYCVDRKVQTVHLSATHPIATSLRAKGFLHYIEGIVFMTSMPFHIPTFIWNELVQRKLELLSQEEWESQELREFFVRLDEAFQETARKAMW